MNFCIEIVSSKCAPYQYDIFHNTYIDIVFLQYEYLNDIYHMQYNMIDILNHLTHSM